MLKYVIGLVNYSFDIGEQNVRLFPNDKDRDNYFESQINYWSEPINFEFRDLINTTQKYLFTDELGIIDLLNKNLAVVKNIDSTEYVYFFIISSKQLAGNIIELKLQIADILTYWNKIEFSDCLINRAHLNRFTQDTDLNYVVFNNGIDSFLLNRELENFPKFLTKRTPIYPYVDTSSIDSPINQIQRDYKIMWLYAYMKDDSLVNTPPPTIDKIRRTRLKENFIDNGCYTYIAPFSADKDNISPYYLQVKLSPNTYAPWEANILMNIFNTARETILNIKISPIPPLQVMDYTDHYIYEEGVVSFKNYDESTKYLLNFQAYESKTKDLYLAGLNTQSINEAYTNYVITFPIRFNKSQIVGQLSNSIFEPKLLSSNFRELRITSYNGESFTYDIQKINQREIKILFREGINVDITKTYIRIVDLVNSVYNKSTNNYFGLVSSSDASLPYSVNQLDQFLAQNKNFNAIRYISMFQRLLSIFTNPQSLLTGSFDILGNEIVRSLTLNNMASAPEQLQNAGGSVLFNTMIDNDNTLSIYIDIYSATQRDIAKAYDFLTKYGYSYNVWDNIKNHTQTRKYYNYIQAKIETVVTGNISNEIINRIKSKLSRGVRFFHVNEINYSLENYERWLEEN